MIIPIVHGALRAIETNRGRLFAVAVSLAAALVVTATTTPISRSTQTLGVAMPRPGLVASEHAAVADYLAAQAEAQQADAAAADRDWARQRALAAGETARQVASRVTPAAKARIAHVAVQPKPAGGAATPVEPPLQLEAMAKPATPAPEPRHRPVVEGVRSAIATAGRIPRWVTAGVKQAADWVIDGPVDTIVRWPERRFL
jgi:hypothetical protein